MRKFKPSISIVIPVYNGADYMREAIDSALAQTYRNFEIIVVNDGSTDNTEEIAKSYGDKIRYFKKENGGVASALNLALKEMKGDYFSWLSHDDAYYPNKLERQIEFLKSVKNKKIILFTDYAEINSRSRVGRKFIGNHQLFEEKPEYALLRGALNGDTILIPKSAFIEYGEFDESLRCTQDYAKWYEMSKTYKFVHIPEILAKYRIHEKQDTQQNPKFITEGNQLWIKMISGLTTADRKRLEGSDFNFYERMWSFLKNTPYKEALSFVGERLKECVSKDKRGQHLVVFVSHSSGNSGAERAMLNSIDVLRAENVSVHVVLPSLGPLAERLEERNVCYSIHKIKPCLKSRWVVKNDIKKEIVANASDLADFFNIIRPDVVVSISSVIFEGAFAAKLAGIPHVWTISEYGVPEHGIRFLIPEAERLDLLKKYSDKVIFVSEALRKYYLDKIKLKNTTVLPPISAKEVVRNKKVAKNFFSQNDSLKIVMAGHIAKGKGQLDAVRAMRLLKRKGLVAELILVGPNRKTKYVQRIQEYIRRNGLGNVRIVPEVEDAIPIFRLADLVLMCSVYESFGRVTAEAMLCGKPVVGTKHGATPELIEDGVTGLLYTPGNYRELAEKIEYLISHREDLKKFGKQGFGKIEKILSQKTDQKIVEELLGVNRVRVPKYSRNMTIKNIEAALGLNSAVSRAATITTDKVKRLVIRLVGKAKRIRDQIREDSK